jgi:SAM-dependent methyltransferase
VRVAHAEPDKPDIAMHQPICYVCPKCRGELTPDTQALICQQCLCRYPVIEGIPVLIDEDDSIFRIAQFEKKEATFFARESGIREVIISALPEKSENRAAKKNYALLSQLLRERNDHPLVLVLGGSILGAGMEEFRAEKGIRFIDTDVAFGPLTKVIADAHSIPLGDGSVDAVVAQAVLEHVAEPERCVSEIHRVLRQGGLLYAETPFLEPAHSTPYDFHRFTFIGYRRLFRKFSMLRMGPIGGPAQALAHQWESTLLCFARSRVFRGLILIFARMSGFWLKYLDRFLNRNPQALHCAFGLYFLGRKLEKALSTSEVIDECRPLC